jgi:glycerol-3-phosphate dehydrogenase
MPARKFILDNNRVTGIEAEDLASGDSISIRGKVVLNAAGPWAHWMLRENLGIELNPGVNFSRDTCFLVKRKLSDRFVLAVMGQTRDPDSIVSRETRHLFIVPWRNYSLVGVWHVVKTEKPDAVTATRAEIDAYIEEVNAAYPGLNINYDEITVCNWGLTLFGENEPGKKDLSYGKRSRLVDHEIEDDIKGLISLIGVRATASRGMAVKAVNLAQRKIGESRIPTKTGSTPMRGGNIKDFSEYMDRQFGSCPVEFDKSVFKSLLRNYGDQYMDVVKYAMEQPQLAEAFEGTNVIKAEMLYAAREEMAQSLSDVVLRRTELGSGGYPGYEILEQCADLLGDELGWDNEQRKIEVDKVIGCYPNISG